MAWKDPNTIAAVQQYVRIVTGVALAVILLWMLVGRHIDIDTVLRVLLGLLALDRGVMAVVSKHRPE